jgi:hypothetical protein
MQRRDRPGARLARLSLLVPAMSCATACFDTPPEYTTPVPVPPVIVGQSVRPLLGTLYVSDAHLSGQDTFIDFHVPFRADEFGVNLISVFVLDDSNASNRSLIGTPDVPSDPRPFDQQPPRDVTLEWHWNGDLSGRLAGCHTVTAIITDAENLRFNWTPKDPTLEARTTWFVWLKVDNNTPTVDCFESGLAQ